MNITDLSKPFPQDAVHWRVQGTPIERNGKWAAMALAYIDARDVMDRLDGVCGPENWQTEYHETAKGRLICRLSICINGAWVTKSDGAGDTDVEGEKGAISDALKRAAVSWGIGRYLYRLSSPWVECEVKQSNGKTYWKAWSGDPWAKVKGAPRVEPTKQQPRQEQAETPSSAEVQTAKEAAAAQPDLPALVTWWKGLNANARHVAKHPEVIAAKDARKAELQRPKSIAQELQDSIPY